MIVDQGPSDEELVVGALEDPNNFSFIIERYEKKLDAYIRRISGANYEERQDLLQDIFLSAYQNLRGYNPAMKFSSWIYRITHNKTISWWRKNKKHVGELSIDEHEDFISSIFNENSVQIELDENDRKEAVSAALMKLKPQYRQIILLAYWEEKSYKEIAEITKSSTGTVGTRLKRARKQFIKYIQEYGI